MSHHRSFNLLVGGIIALVAVLSTVTAISAQQGDLPNSHNAPTYVALKDRQLSQWETRTAQVGTGTLTPVQAPPLEQVEVMAVTGPAETVEARPTSLSGAERYADLKDAQLARLYPEVMSAGRARYMDFKNAQLDQ